MKLQQFVGVALTVLSGLVAIGCVSGDGETWCGEGEARYESSLTLVDGSGAPVPGTSILLTYHPDDPNRYPPTENILTDAKGRAVATAFNFTAWSVCESELEMQIDQPIVAPVPSAPPWLDLWVRSASCEWKQYRLEVRPDQVVAAEPGIMTLDLGVVTVQWP